MIECCNCSAFFWVTNSFDVNKHETKDFFYCPNGHGQSYTKSTAEKLQDKLDSREIEIRILHTEIDHQNAKIKTLKPKKTKKKKSK